MSAKDSIRFRRLYFVVWFFSFHFALLFLICSLSSIRFLVCRTPTDSIIKKREHKRRFCLLICVFLLETASSPFIYNEAVPFMCLPSDGVICVYSYNWLEQLPRCKVTHSSLPTSICVAHPHSPTQWCIYIIAAFQSMQVLLLSLLMVQEKKRRHCILSTTCLCIASLLSVLATSGAMGPVLLFFCSCGVTSVGLVRLPSYRNHLSAYVFAILNCVQGFAALSSVESVGPVVRMLSLGLKVLFFFFLSTLGCCQKNQQRLSHIRTNYFDDNEQALCESQLRAEQIAFQQVQLFLETRTCA